MSEPEKLDYAQLNKLLDITKTHVFQHKNAAFLGSLLCSMDFHWSGNIPTAGVNTDTFIWNPHWFLSLKPKVRETVLMHELWHIAMLHVVRGEGRHATVWNWACDIWINNGLERDGYSFEGVEDCWKDQAYGNESADEIYAKLSKLLPPPTGSWGDKNGQGDIDSSPPTPAQKQNMVNKVIQAQQIAKLSGQPGSIPGEIEIFLDKFLRPIIPWEIHLQQFFTELCDEDFSMKRPNRRYHDMYLSSVQTDESRLTHLLYFEDVSGSISDKDNVRFNSELKYVWDTFQPEKMTVAQFDTRITQVIEFNDGEPFDHITIIGRGGTSLVPVREMIEKLKPTAVIIFSDMYVGEMAPLTDPIPVLWVSINNPTATVPFGKLIHIRS